MSKRSNQSSLLSLGVKRIRCGGIEGENSSEGQPESEPPDDEDHDGHDHYDTVIDTIDELMECLSDCCEPDHEGPNQPKSTQILAATRCVQSHQARYVQAVWFSQHPWLFVRQEKNFFVTTALLLRKRNS